MDTTKIIKTILIVFLVWVLMGASTAEADFSRVNNIKKVYLPEMLQEQPEVNYMDSIDTYIALAKISREQIDKSKKVLDLNSGYSYNLKVKKDTLVEELNTLVIQVVDGVSREVWIKTSTIMEDSICVDTRGFIGNKIFGKDKCKEWEVERYVVTDLGEKITLKDREEE